MPAYTLHCARLDAGCPGYCFATYIEETASSTEPDAQHMHTYAPDTHTRRKNITQHKAFQWDHFLLDCKKACFFYLFHLFLLYKMKILERKVHRVGGNDHRTRGVNPAPYIPPPPYPRTPREVRTWEEAIAN